MAESSGNWLSNFIKNSLSKTKLSDMLGGNADLAANADLPAQAVSPHLVSDRYETPLSMDEEKKFQIWKEQYAPHDSGLDYDYRGAFKAGLRPDTNSHWPDTYKKPNHPTFSNESIYAKDAPEKAGKWIGDTFIPPSTKTIQNGDELLNFYKQALWGEQKPADILFGGVPISFDVAGSTAPVFPGFPGEMYNTRLSRFNPKYKPVKRQ